MSASIQSSRGSRVRSLINAYAKQTLLIRYVILLEITVTQMLAQLTRNYWDLLIVKITRKSWRDTYVVHLLCWPLLTKGQIWRMTLCTCIQVHVRLMHIPTFYFLESQSIHFDVSWL